MHFNSRLRGAIFEALGEDIEPVVVAMRRDADIAEGEQRCRVTVAIMTGRVHHRHIDAWLLERLDVVKRQQQLFTGITRRVEIEASAINQVGHLQQFV